MLISTHIFADMVSSIKLAFPSVSTVWDITEHLTYSTQLDTKRYLVVGYANIWLPKMSILVKKKKN